VNVTLNVSELGEFSSCDVNRDGAIDIRDVQDLIDQTLGVRPPSSDFIGSSVVNVVDVQLGMNAVLGLGCAAQ
jgi:hypothetical protein